MRILRPLVAVAVSPAFVLTLPLAVPATAAPSCPAVEVIFARGTYEPAGLGSVGQAFVDALVPQLGARTVEVYPVDYPATDDYANSAAAGAADVESRIGQIAAACPATKIVMGGYSQGAAVMGMATSAIPPTAGDHVAAVAVFGSPASGFSTMLNGGAPLPTLSPAYAAKAIDLCTPGDPICSPGADLFAHTSYIQSGMVDEAATFAASKITPATTAAG